MARVLLGEFTAGMTILVGLDSENDELTFEGISSPNTPIFMRRPGPIRPLT